MIYLGHSWLVYGHSLMVLCHSGVIRNRDMFIIDICWVPYKSMVMNFSQFEEAMDTLTIVNTSVERETPCGLLDLSGTHRSAWL